MQFETTTTDRAKTSLGQAAVALTIGNFDGCHLGHQRLIARTLELSLRLGAKPAALSFDPHPELVLRGEAPPRLATAAQKTRAFAELGLAFEILQTFDQAFGRVSHAEFYERLLKQTLRARAIVVGSSFRFGHGRIGDTAYLGAAGMADGITVEAMPPALEDGEPVSSTRIRGALAHGGKVELVRAMLGRPYMLEGTILRGDQLGRTIGFPTANLEGIEQLVPAHGVYAGYVHLGADPTFTRLPSQAVPAAFNIGVRPTVKQAKPSLRVEAHLLAGTYGVDALYGMRAGFYLTHRLRDELKFGSMEEMVGAISADVVRAKTLL